MADYKVVDADKLDADLGAVADAIRDRAGTTEPLSFPDGMATAVTDIPDYLAARLTNTLTTYSGSVWQVYNYGFAQCEKLTSVNLPDTAMLQYNCFLNCTTLVNVYMPKVSNVGQNAFANCSILPLIDFPLAGSISQAAFTGCRALETLILRRSDKLCTLGNVNAFTNTPIASGTGYIYVPSSLVDSYKAATNWSTFADQIRAIEDYPEITGGATA